LVRAGLEYGFASTGFVLSRQAALNFAGQRGKWMK
jgi:hypothetical protein